MSSVSIIGTGNMGAAIAHLAAKGGSSVQVLARDIEKSEGLAAQLGGTGGVIGDAVTGDIVVLAVPYTALADLAAAYAEQWAGKTVVDVTNPLDFTTFSLIPASDSSAAAELAAAAPAANVVKAFNTNFGATLATGEVGGVPTTVLVAGDDAEAKQAVVDLVTAGGLEAADAGALTRARELEALALLQMGAAVGGTIAWTGGFALRK
jgi:predicted dinucleotide-binding enzyme